MPRGSAARLSTITVCAAPVGSRSMSTDTFAALARSVTMKAARNKLDRTIARVIGNAFHSSLACQFFRYFAYQFQVHHFFWRNFFFQFERRFDVELDDVFDSQRRRQSRDAF